MAGWPDKALFAAFNVVSFIAIVVYCVYRIRYFYTSEGVAMPSALENSSLPDPRFADIARESSVALAQLLRSHPEQDRAHVRMDGADLVLPRQAIELLRNILNEMAQGNGVTILPVHAELTTQEAANLLNVSRPHLIKLLEAGELPFSKVGTHRRITLQDLMAYKAGRDAESEAAMQELVDQAQELDMGY